MQKFKYVSTNRRVREDRRFVSGSGRYAADIVRPGTLHVALVASQYPAANLKIDVSEALKLSGVHYVLAGEELAKGTDPLMNGLDTPRVRRYPLAVGRCRYAGEWVAAVVAETRALAEDAAEKVRVDYQPLPYVINAEEAYKPTSPPVHPDHGSNVLFERKFTWGEVDRHFADSAHQISHRVVWGRSATVPIETFGVLAAWDAWNNVLDVWASIQMPKYADQIARAMRLPMNAVRVHQDVDVGGSYGVKRGIKHTVLASFLSRKLDRPIRLIEDRLENMRAGDGHGPDRIFDVSAAFNADGVIRSIKIRALDNVGAYAGRSPFQLGKPVGAIVGPYHIESAEYHPICVTTNKAAQEAVRGMGQSPTNYAIESTIERVADFLDLDRLETRRRNLIRHEQFPYLIPSGTEYDSGDYHAVIDKVVNHVDMAKLERERDELRRSGWLAGIGYSTCLEPSGGNSGFEPLFNEKNKTTTWMDSCRISVDALGTVMTTVHTTSSGQGHETLVATAVGEILEIDPDQIQVVRPTSLESLPSNSPVGSRMAVMLGGAAFHAAQKMKKKLMRIAAHDLRVPEDQLRYSSGTIEASDGRRLTWTDLVEIAHRQYFRMPPGMDPGLGTMHIYQVPNAGKLPTPDGRVQMYPCYSFEFHLLLMAIDPAIGRPEIRKYVIGHDCGTVINPDIVKGMTLGGVAHAIGAALLEEFVYDDEGQLITQTFMDYLLPSAHEVPKVELIKHCTPSPHTVFGQKGSGEAGYLGGPAALASGVNDALKPLGIAPFTKLPIRISAIGDAIASARQHVRLSA
jgi:2-furoyl-CoA dehydrogenase large subunit